MGVAIGVSKCGKEGGREERRGGREGGKKGREGGKKGREGVTELGEGGREEYRSDDFWCLRDGKDRGNEWA